MYVKLFKLKCLTNLHVGNGDVNFNVVDNEVEKDPINHYPIINASGVKGALRDYFNNAGVAKEAIDGMFGSQPNARESSNSSSGQIKLLSAWMLARPLRATKGAYAYYLTTTPAAWEQFRSLANALGFTGAVPDAERVPAAMTEAEAENLPLEDSYYSFDDEKLFIMSNENFRGISLPVIARNSTGSVNKKNLWYEEFVPHESVFYFFAISDDADLLEQFCRTINGKAVQFGGNASIGYGLCKVTELKGAGRDE